jgi:hypothetical protein
MVPSEFVFLKEWPLTPNGKVDRKALPAPEISQRKLDIEYLAPRTPVEEALAELWGGLLPTEKVGVNDNFFDLGGHSLLAARMMSHVRDVFEVALPLRRLFETPTIGGLAVGIEAAMMVSEAGSLVLQRLLAGEKLPIRQALLAENPVPASTSPAGLDSRNEQMEGSQTPGRRNVHMTFNWEGPLDVERLQRSINQVVRQNDGILQNGFHAGSHPKRDVLPEPFLLLEPIDLRATEADKRESEARRLVDEAISHGFDDTGNLPLRTTLLRLDTDRYIIALVADQLFVNSWPINELLSEALTLYRSPLTEQASKYSVN